MSERNYHVRSEKVSPAKKPSLMMMQNDETLSSCSRSVKCEAEKQHLITFEPREKF
jgi:hypothetical protein